MLCISFLKKQSIEDSFLFLLCTMFRVNKFQAYKYPQNEDVKNVYNCHQYLSIYKELIQCEEKIQKKKSYRH